MVAVTFVVRHVEALCKSSRKKGSAYNGGGYVRRLSQRGPMACLAGSSGHSSVCLIALFLGVCLRLRSWPEVFNWSRGLCAGAGFEMYPVGADDGSPGDELGGGSE
jgi:hypothetical protein